MGRQAQLIPALPLALNRQSGLPFRQQRRGVAHRDPERPAASRRKAALHAAPGRRPAMARMTVVHAFEQLYAEGYVEGMHGAAPYIAALWATIRWQPPRSTRAAQTASPARALSRRGAALVATREL